MTTSDSGALPSQEETRLFNPAFLSLIVREAAKGYSQETQAPFPLPLAFVVPAVTLHRRSREALPGTVRTDLLVWMQQHPEIRFLAAGRAARLSIYVKQGILLGSHARILNVGPSGLGVGEGLVSNSALSRVTLEAGSCLSRARFMGRWMARSGSPIYQLTLWGIVP